MYNPSRTRREGFREASAGQARSIKEFERGVTTRSGTPLTSRSFPIVAASSDTLPRRFLISSPGGVPSLNWGLPPPREPGRAPPFDKRPASVLGSECSPPAVCQKAGGPGTGLAHTKACTVEKTFQAAHAFAVRSGPDQSDATRSPAAVKPGHGAPKTVA